MRADLHMHSIYSDGMCTPEELVDRAKLTHVTLASVTDHDNFLGWKEKRAAFERAKITYVDGIEVSAYENKKKVHITGYAFNVDDPLLAQYQKKLYDNSVLRLYDVLDKLKFYKKIFVAPEEVFAEQEVKNIPVHTMHVVKAIQRKGYYRSYREIFKACFLPELPTYSFVGRPTPEDAIEMIHSLGGICSVAHPGRIEMEADEREKLIYRLKEMGIDGMECIYSTHTAEQTEYFIRLAKTLDLLCTGGSDFHSDFGLRTVGNPPFTPDEKLLRALKIKL